MSDSAPDVPTPIPVGPESEMRISKPWGEIIAAIVFVPIVICIVVFFVVLAVTNLVLAWKWQITLGIRLASVVASCLWLLLVGAILVTACREAGPRKLLVDFLGLFARRHFIERTAGESHPAEISIGYQLLWHRFYYLKVDVGRIRSVSWSHGQMADRAVREGRDVSDWSVWSVAMWFDRDHGSKEGSPHPQSGRDLIIIGPERRWRDTEAFGLAVIAFLRAAGAALTERGESTRRQTRDSDAAGS